MAGVPGRLAKRTSELIPEVLRLNAEGRLPSEIARELRAKPDTVRKLLRRAGVYRSRRGGHRWHKFSGELQTRVGLRYQSGERVLAIAHDLNISEGSIYYILKRQGVSADRAPHPQPNGAASHLWRGGRTVNRQGYVWLWLAPDDPMRVMARGRYVLEHRLVMARNLGRPLFSDETVHHINGKRDDNRIENLQLRNGRHGSGTALRCAECGSVNIIPTTLL